MIVEGSGTPSTGKKAKAEAPDKEAAICTACWEAAAAEKVGKGDGPYCKIHRTKGYDLQECYQVEQLVKRQRAEYDKHDKEKAALARRSEIFINGCCRCEGEIEPSRGQIPLTPDPPHQPSHSTHHCLSKKNTQPSIQIPSSLLPIHPSSLSHPTPPPPPPTTPVTSPPAPRKQSRLFFSSQILPLPLHISSCPRSLPRSTTAASPAGGSGTGRRGCASGGRLVGGGPAEPQRPSIGGEGIGGGESTAKTEGGDPSVASSSSSGTQEGAKEMLDQGVEALRAEEHIAADAGGRAGEPRIGGSVDWCFYGEIGCHCLVFLCILVCL
nr:forkhead box protein D1 [Aegilops tauschii subsp. strangulata]